MKISSSQPGAPGLLGKVSGSHLDRLAIVYVRQSTQQQIGRHQESTRMQYALVDKACNLGWPKERVLVIDEDLGRSGANAEGRPGFQNLVAEVGLDHVGIVLGIEMSRLARSCRDWHQLLEICALFQTLIGDADGVYDPTCYNDRLLLGLKGTMSEAELHILRQRMLEGKKAKARRGELGFHLPMGYVKRPSGEVIKDPDEQAQAAINLVFNLFEQLGSLSGVLANLVKNNIKMPCRSLEGPMKGELEWHTPKRGTLVNMLRHPIYAGAYVYGRRQVDPRKKIPGRPSSGRSFVKSDKFEVLIKDKLPAYIAWEQYRKNSQQLLENAPKNKGVVRNGTSLLSGLLVCKRCGRRMATSYNSSGYALRYVCNGRASEYGEPRCQSLVGSALDDKITSLVFDALEPAALKLSLKVAAGLETEQAAIGSQWAMRLERARYEVERSFRQYNAIEPENRLVGRTLEKQLEKALADEESLKSEHARFLQQEPLLLSKQEQQAIKELANNIPALWNASTTTNAEKQSIVRCLIERILVHVIDDTENVQLTVHWAGGFQTSASLVRPVAHLQQLSSYPELVARVTELRSEGKNLTAIADTLASEGWPLPRLRSGFTVNAVRNFLRRTGIQKVKRVAEELESHRQANEVTVLELGQKLGMPGSTLYRWIRNGEIEGRKISTSVGVIWLLKADDAALKRLSEKYEICHFRSKFMKKKIRN